MPPDSSVRPKTSSGNEAPYWRHIIDDIDARQEWNRMDDEIIQRRLAKRKRNNQQYKGAPNPVINILDDVTSEKNDQEISMILNAPQLAYFIPTNGAPADVVSRAQQGFDTFLRHVLDYRVKKEESVDHKNLRGFCPVKVKRTKDPKYGVIPDFEPMDCKDVIVPVDTKVPVNDLAERIVGVLRFSNAGFRAKKREGWMNVEKVLKRLMSVENEEDSNQSVHDDDYALKVKEEMLGINVSSQAQDQIVVWEVCHLATDWDKKHAPEAVRKDVRVGKRVISYINPDNPEFLLKIIPWKEEDVEEPLNPLEAGNEFVQAQLEGRTPITTRTVIGEDKPWPYLQHRFQNRSRFWYDVWGIGHKCMDNQLIATGVMKKKMMWMDFATNFMFEDDGSGVNQATFKVAPGAKLPKGWKIAQIPQAPQNMDFDIDSQKRDASAKAGASSGQFSGQVTQKRTLEKTATEVRTEAASNAMTTSASVDRFNDADKDLFAMLWEDLARLKKELPIVQQNRFVGTMDAGVYDYEYIIVPAASQKTLNPELQFIKDREKFEFLMQYAQMASINVTDSLQHIMQREDPNFAQIALPDPNEQGPQGQPPLYQMMQQFMQGLQQLAQVNDEQDQQLEDTMKLATENSEKIEDNESKMEEARVRKTQEGQ